MSHVRATALLCACALIANVAAKPIPAPPATVRSQNKETKMVQEKTTILVRRIPNTYFFPFSLWPLPKYPMKDREAESHESFHYRRSLQGKEQMRQNKR